MLHHFLIPLVILFFSTCGNNETQVQDLGSDTQQNPPGKPENQLPLQKPDGKVDPNKPNDLSGKTPQQPLNPPIEEDESQNEGSQESGNNQQEDNTEETFTDGVIGKDSYLVTSGQVKRTKLNIGGKSDAWLTKVGIDLNKTTSGVVNAQNDEVSYTWGGGLNGDKGLRGYMHWKNSKESSNPNDWKNLRWPNGNPLPKGDRNRKGLVKAGKFAVSDFKWGKCFQAVGVQASHFNTSDTNDLKRAEKIMDDLTYDMIVYAHKIGLKVLVVHALGTGIFGQEGAFNNAVYTGINKGAVRGLKKINDPTFMLIFNNFSQRVITNLPGLIR